MECAKIDPQVHLGPMAQGQPLAEELFLHLHFSLQMCGLLKNLLGLSLLRLQAVSQAVSAETGQVV